MVISITITSPKALMEQETPTNMRYFLDPIHFHVPSLAFGHAVSNFLRESD